MTLFPRDMRQRLRNPSIPFVLGVLFVAFAALAGALTPVVIRGVENYNEVRELQQRDFIEAPGAWVRPWLVDKARIMIDARQPIEWRPTDFQFGPCNPDNIRQLSNPGFREAIAFSCGAFHEIQLKYAGHCAETNFCNVPEDAKGELRAVIAVLDDAFDEAGFVGPMTREEPPR